jgi:hypothetical protein
MQETDNKEKGNLKMEDRQKRDKFRNFNRSYF